MQDLKYNHIQPWMALFIFERFIDIYFTTDIIINFRSAWVDHEGNVLYNWKKGVSHALGV